MTKTLVYPAGSATGAAVSPRLTNRLLLAMDAAVGAMLAGMEGEGDWPDDIARQDLDDAECWITAQLALRQRKVG